MKKLLLSVFCSSFLLTAFSQHSLEKLWETDSVFKVPESVLPDLKKNLVYVSNIDGTDPWGKDGKGFISKLGLDGKVITLEWVKGLNAPKGMGMFRNNLFVADLNEVVVIDIEKGEVLRKVVVPNAENLNDITVDPKGIVYVSDSKTKRVYRIQGSNANPHLEGLQGPNGVLWHKENLYILDRGGFYRVEYDRSLTKIVDGIEGGSDGLQAVYDKEYIASGWAGVIYYINADGTKEILLDSRAEKINTADIAFDAGLRILYVPTFFKNKIVAYKLK
jgi:DNA-binding beta-propeller fold protein YncE